jgi:hypothetical protein
VSSNPIQSNANAKDKKRKKTQNTFFHTMIDVGFDFVQLMVMPRWGCTVCLSTV